MARSKSEKALLGSIQADITAIHDELDRIDDDLKQKRDTRSRALLLKQVEKLEELETGFQQLIQDIGPFMSDPEPEPDPGPEPESEQETGQGQRTRGTGSNKKTRRGERTPQQEFIIPILLVLQKHGGRAASAVVIEDVGKLMEHCFSDVDKQPLKSDYHEIRWQNTVRWARNDMVHELGFLRSDSSHGIWEITDKGRIYLNDTDIS